MGSPHSRKGWAVAITIKTRNIADSAVTAAKLASNAVTVAKLSATMQTGIIDIPLARWRVTDNANSNVGLVAATALIGSGGVGGIDAEPALTRVNAATDKQTKIMWVDAKLDPIWADFNYPPDLDDAAVITFNCIASMSGTNDLTSTLTLSFFENGVGTYAADTNAGGATAAIATANPLLYTVVIAAANVGAYPKHVSVDLTPTSPGTDSMNLWATWFTYTRK